MLEAVSLISLLHICTYKFAQMGALKYVEELQKKKQSDVSPFPGMFFPRR